MIVSIDFDKRFVSIDIIENNNYSFIDYEELNDFERAEFNLAVWGIKHSPMKDKFMFIYRNKNGELRNKRL